MSWQGEKVLVTGAGGFIGSHLTERLVQLGARTRAFVHYRATGTWGWLDESPYKHHLEIVVGDITDRDSVRHAMQGIDIVFHLAALIAIPFSYQAPTAYLRTNVEGTLNVLQAALEMGVKRVVHTSTSEVYGTARYVPIDENHPLQGQSPYAATKIAADKLAEAFHCSYNLPIAIIRPFNTFGPRQSARAIIPTIITQALTKDAIELGNLQPTRDFSYIADTVEGFIRVAESSASIGEVINVGSGREISVAELARTIMQEVGRDLPIVQDEKRIRPNTSEVNRLLADISKARRLLSWQPRYTLEEGLRLTVEWIRHHLEHYRPDVYVL